MKDLHGWLKVVKTRVGRLNDEAGGAGYLLCSLARAGGGVDNEKIKPCGFLKRLFRRGEALDPDAGFNPVGEAAALPRNACPLLRVEVGNLDAKPPLRGFAGEATGKGAFPDSAFLRDERYNIAPLVLLGRHKKLAPDNCHQM